MIVGSSLTIEIGDRTLLRDASFVVGAGEKVALVGRNGTGKSTFISVVIDEPGRNVRSTGNSRIRGTFGYLPQVPVPHGLGLDPNGFSHVLSGRGLDVLDDALDKARTQMAKDPTTENIELFSDLEEQFRENGGYEAESTMARLADGLGLRQELLLDDIESLSGGQRRRVDLIRILFQGPDTMILDEPTNHLDLPAKRWLMEELERFPGAILVVSHDLKLLDRSIDKVLHLADGRLHEFKGTYSSYLVQLEADQSQRERSALLEGREIKRLSTLADSMRGSTNRRARIAKSLDKRVERLESAKTEVHKREKKSSFRLPDPQALRRGAAAGRRPLGALRPGHRAREGRLPLPAGRPGGRHRPQRSRQVEPAAMPGRGAGARRPARSSSAPTSPSATSPRSTSRSTSGSPSSTTSTTPSWSTRPSAGPCSARSGSPARRPTRCPRPCRAASGPSWAWPCWPPGGPTCSCSTSPPTTSTRPPSRRSAPCSAAGRGPSWW